MVQQQFTNRGFKGYFCATKLQSIALQAVQCMQCATDTFYYGKLICLTQPGAK